jgi:hypothetical protein
MKNRVCELKVILEGAKFFDSPINRDLLQSLSGKLPVKFYYNSGWEVFHYCTSCESETSFGMKYNPEKTRFPVYDFERSQRICQKNYTKDLIIELSEMFTNVQMYQQSGQVFLAHPGKFDKQFPVSSSLSLIKYTCKNCGTFFLNDFEMFSPIPPDRGMVDGKLGLIEINEILEMEKERKHLERLIFASSSS